MGRALMWAGAVAILFFFAGFYPVVTSDDPGFWMLPMGICLIAGVGLIVAGALAKYRPPLLCRRCARPLSPGEVRATCRSCRASAHISCWTWRSRCPWCGAPPVEPPSPDPGDTTPMGTCQVCGTEIVGRGRRVECVKCRTPHHADCWDYNGGCSTYACGGVRKRR